MTMVLVSADVNSIFQAGVDSISKFDHASGEVYWSREIFFFDESSSDSDLSQVYDEKFRSSSTSTKVITMAVSPEGNQLAFHA